MMDTLQFIASLTGSLVWPVSISALLLAYRRPITERISSLNHAKYKDFEVFFGREIRELDAKVKAPLPPVAHGDASVRQAPQAVEAQGNVEHAPPVLAKATEDSLGDAERLIKNRLYEEAIFSAWATVETELKSFLRRAGVSDYATPQISTREQINVLAQDALADDQTVDVLRRMYNLFEMLAFKGGYSVQETEDNAREYVFLARSVIQRLRRWDKGAHPSD